MFQHFFPSFYDNFNDLCFPFNCSSPFLPLFAPYLHSSLEFIFKSNSFFALQVCTAATKMLKHRNSLNADQMPALIWAVLTRRKQMASGWAGTNPNQAQTAQGICFSCAHCVRITLTSTLRWWRCTFCHCFSLLPESKGTGEDLEAHCHIPS